MRPSSRTWHLRIDGQPVDGVKGLAHGLVERGMGVDGLHHQLDGGLRFHGGHGLADQLEAFRPDDMDAEDFAVALVSHYFDEAFMMADDGGAAIARERESAHLYVIAL